MIDLVNVRLVDLSKKLQPGIKHFDGTYMHGTELRRLELREFIFAGDNTYMYWVETETHIGTHVEGPSHYLKGEKDIASLPLENFIGEALVIALTHKKPNESICPNDLEGVNQGDIVLLFASKNYKMEERPYIAPDAAEYFYEKRIKMLGIDDSISIEAPGSMATHDFLLRNDIPIIEGLDNLQALTKQRFFFIGFPLRIAGLDSSWIRAVALEEAD
ncbi:cyclase family protein [Candidatus Borrarchaeum sp.]|uniref:cyclase family protein n=1 Tax=Candidatus Borrarchaeum sp. TaxID=2846742 RepID=UPI00257C741F|nr:cyclase family protein [Candidatus Borrarchaeum sp.]